MSNTSDLPAQNRERFFSQLLSSLVSAEPIAEADRQCLRSWLTLSNAAAATLLTPRTPQVLDVLTCTSSESGMPSFQESAVQESFASLLHAEFVLQIAPIHDMDNRRVVFLWPDLAAALVVEFYAPDETHRQSDGLFREEFDEAAMVAVSRQLLVRTSANPVMFPNPAHMAAMAEYAAGAGHEINNPLGSIIGQTQLLLRGENGIDRRQSLETIGAQAWRIRDMIGDSMLFARPPAPCFQKLNLLPCFADAVTRTAATHAAGQVVVEFHCAETELTAECDKVQILSMLNHLIRNGIEAVRSVGNAGRITVQLSTSRRGHALELVVRDSGPGIHDSEIRRHMFDPFYSGRQAGRGLGFGLSLCARIVQQHHGMLLHYAAEDSVTEFHVALPLRQFGRE